jgi:putative peptide zinc metalloprotease protein
MSAPRLAPEDTVAFRDVSVTEDASGQFVLGDLETGEFVSLPEQGIIVVREFQRGHTAAEVSESFRARFGEAPDLDAFVSALADVGLVNRVGDTILGAAPQRSRGVVLLGGLTQRHCRWLLSPVVTVLSVAAWVCLALLLAIGRTPRAEDALVYPSVLVLLVVFVPVAWVLLALHELSHSLVARALGCPAYTRLGNRLWNLVCETDLSSIYSLPRRQRLRPLLAGMTFDVLVLDACLILRASHTGGRPPYVVAYMLFSNLVFQTCIFMRTDFYYVVTTATRLDNLVPQARAECAYLVRAFLRRQRRRPAMVGGRRIAVRGYLAGCLIGIALGAVTVVQLIVPASLGVVELAVAAVRRGPGDPEFWAAMFVVGFFAFVYTALGWTFVRNRRDTARQRAIRQPG